jgi:CRISPR-associated endonuclease Csn1
MKKRIWFIVLISCLLCGCIRRDRTLDSQLMDSREVDFSEENENNKEDITEQWEKGYDLPINETERKEAEDECKKVLVLISDIYILADKGDAVNPVLDDKTIYKMQDRIKEYGNAKSAFANLDENPIWLNKEKGITIKRVSVSGISKAQSLHEKKDKDGNFILDKDSRRIPVDFVNTGNNHHVAIYRKPVLDKKGQAVFDENGELKFELEEVVVSFFDAVTRVNLSQPIIDKDYKRSEGWKFLFSMKQNEYFVFPNEKTGFDPKEIDLLNPENYALISPNLFRVQKIASKDYVFRHHLETVVADRKELQEITWKRISSLSILNRIIKVRVNHIGQIVMIGEY